MASPGLNEMQTTTLRSRPMKKEVESKSEERKEHKTATPLSEGHGGTHDSETGWSNPVKNHGGEAHVFPKHQGEAHGFGHFGGERKGNLRMSGHAGAHRIGHKKGK